MGRISRRSFVRRVGAGLATSILTLKHLLSGDTEVAHAYIPCDDPNFIRCQQVGGYICAQLEDGTWVLLKRIVCRDARNNEVCEDYYEIVSTCN
jgi:hypothetical protein